jgi:hypothetical protein
LLSQTGLVVVCAPPEVLRQDGRRLWKGPWEEGRIKGEFLRLMMWVVGAKSYRDPM